MMPFRAALLHAAAAVGGGGITFASVKLLCGFEGADGSTTFTDESSFARAVSGSGGGNEQIDTAQFKYGSSSLLLDGNFDHVNCADSADWAFGTGPFCVEAWIRPAAFGSDRPVFFYGTTSANWDLYVLSDGRLRWRYVRASDSVTVSIVENAATMTTGNWYHICADRDASGNQRLYINGALVAAGSGTTNPVSEGTAHRTISGLMRIGRNQSSATAFNGHVDEVRIIKGETPYGGAFTPPAAAFPRS